MRICVSVRGRLRVRYCAFVCVFATFRVCMVAGSCTAVCLGLCVCVWLRVVFVCVFVPLCIRGLCVCVGLRVFVALCLW